MLNAPGSINYSISLYPKVRWVTAFKLDQTTSATVDKPHCKRQRQTDLSKKKKPREKRKKKVETTDVEYSKTHRQKVHKGFLILFLAHTLFTSSCAPKVLLETGAVEKSWREKK